MQFSSMFQTLKVFPDNQCQEPQVVLTNLVVAQARKTFSVSGML